MGEALRKGAAGVLVRDAARAGRATDAVVVEADDTTRALQNAGRFVRRESRSRVVAITGSAGKTTTKEITADLLAARYQVFRNKGNLNNHIGLPLSLLELRSGPDVAVVELGMNHPGEIRTLVGIAEPEVRVWTNVGDAHIGFFESADAIADAKAELLENARPEDVLVANADDAAADVARRIIHRPRRHASGSMLMPTFARCRSNRGASKARGQRSGRPPVNSGCARRFSEWGIFRTPSPRLLSR